MIYKDKAFLWLESIKTQVKTKTVETYTNALHNHIIPHFGDCEIGDVSRKDVCAFLNAQAESGNSRTGKGLSKSSMNCIFTVLKNTLHSDAFFEVSRKEYFYAIPTSLRKVTITKQTDIPDYAFSNCDLIEEIMFSSITSTGTSAFENCNALVTDLSESE